MRYLLLAVLFTLALPIEGFSAACNDPQYELVKKSDLADLRKNAEIGKSIGRFTLHTAGFNTLRFDTATGQSCLLIALPEELNSQMQLLAADIPSSLVPCRPIKAR
jgi:hypothetical protein